MGWLAMLWGALKMSHFAFLRMTWAKVLAEGILEIILSTDIDVKKLDYSHKGRGSIASGRVPYRL